VKSIIHSSSLLSGMPLIAMSVAASRYQARAINRTLVPALLGLFVVFSSASLGQQSAESGEMPARETPRKALGTAPTEAKVISGTSPQEYELTAKDKSGKEKSVHVRLMDRAIGARRPPGKRNDDAESDIDM
jgi:hypothetical protein